MQRSFPARTKLLSDMAEPLRLRHELKYYISFSQYEVLRRMLAATLNPDPHADENNEYHIRSLYFDTVFDSALNEKIAGVSRRDKYRIRIYNLSDAVINMECKSKYDTLISKRSTRISRLVSEQIIATDPSGLENTSSGLLRDVFREMRLNFLHPVVIVDYVREAYLHPAEDIRITFDKQLRTGLNSIDLFNKNVPTIPVFPHETIILEVKFNRTLPPYISNILSLAAGWSTRSAISKYTFCRQYEGKSF
ncbi:MAG: polyphosphate polymerase domain-containing protein [Eubacteriales bacterium]|nr:polyphosphate polymerase domain-containing protein [Eubacteriales bacterium]